MGCQEYICIAAQSFRLESNTILCLSTASEAVDLVRDKGLDDGGAGMHVARGKAEL